MIRQRQMRLFYVDRLTEFDPVNNNVITLDKSPAFWEDHEKDNL